jgi:hypothetical protein
VSTRKRARAPAALCSVELRVAEAVTFSEALTAGFFARLLGRVDAAQTVCVPTLINRLLARRWATIAAVPVQHEGQNRAVSSRARHAHNSHAQTLARTPSCAHAHKRTHKRKHTHAHATTHVHSSVTAHEPVAVWIIEQGRLVTVAIVNPRTAARTCAGLLGRRVEAVDANGGLALIQPARVARRRAAIAKVPASTRAEGRAHLKTPRDLR